MTTKRYEVTFGKQRIPFTLEFRNRERLAISVHPDRSVTVAAPKDRAVEDVVERVQRRAAWISKQRAYFEQLQPLTPPRQYVAGETHFYIGRQYRLKLVEGNELSVKLIGQFLTACLPNRDDRGRVCRMLDEWYLVHAKDVFSRRVDVCLQSARSLRLSPPRVGIRKMAKRWGSCTKAGRILLNTELVKTPLHCIEYVIMHELCHLKIHDHSPQFYRLLARCMPDWERRKQRLESFVL